MSVSSDLYVVWRFLLRDDEPQGASLDAMISDLLATAAPGVAVDPRAARDPNCALPTDPALGR